MEWLKRLFVARPDQFAPAAASHECDGRVEFEGDVIDLADGAQWVEGIPHPDMERAREWADRYDDESYPRAWLAVQREWMGWVAVHLGETYRLHESGDSLLVSPQPMRAVQVALEHLSLTQRRVERSLGALAEGRYGEKQIVLMIPDEDDYYRYLSGRYPGEGEFPMSAGVHFGGPGPHFVVGGEDFDKAQPTVVHEMTHAFVSHLPIPLWLNEGLAVNMEIAFGQVADAHRLVALQAKQRTYWTPELIQDFWSGEAFQRADDGNELAYDLGRLMVVALSSDWPRFQAFACEAAFQDSGADAAARHLGVDLGEFVRHYLGREDGDWAPLTR